MQRLHGKRALTTNYCTRVICSCISQAPGWGPGGSSCCVIRTGPQRAGQRRSCSCPAPAACPAQPGAPLGAARAEGEDLQKAGQEEGGAEVTQGRGWPGASLSPTPGTVRLCRAQHPSPCWSSLIDEPCHRSSRLIFLNCKILQSY